MKVIYSILVCLLISCSNAKSNFSENSTKNIITVDFCKECDSLSKWIGGIQGIYNNDSTGIFPFAECHTNKSYDLIWTPKGDIIEFKKSLGSDRLMQYYKNAEIDNFKNMYCYAFVIPKKRRIPKEDLGEFEYLFPSSVEIYVRHDELWKEIPSKTVNSFEELGRLKLNTIYNIK